MSWPGNRGPPAQGTGSQEAEELCKLKGEVEKGPPVTAKQEAEGETGQEYVRRGWVRPGRVLVLPGAVGEHVVTCCLFELG